MSAILLFRIRQSSRSGPPGRSLISWLGTLDTESHPDNKWKVENKKPKASTSQTARLLTNGSTKKEKHVFLLEKVTHNYNISIAIDLKSI